MTLHEIARRLTPEDFAEMRELRKNIYNQRSQDKLFRLYEKYVNQLLGNAPGTRIVEDNCGKCRSRILLRITEIVKIYGELENTV